MTARECLHLTFAAVSLLLSTHIMAWPWTDKSDLDGIVIEYGLAPDASHELRAVDAVTDSGERIFGPSVARYGVLGVNSLGNVRVPKWVRVTWREGDTTLGSRGFFGGTIVGDYTIPVLDRIPDEVFDLVRAKPKRSLMLRFRIKEDGVLLGWAVHEGGRNCKLLYGGDFVDQVTTEFDVKKWRDHVIEHRWVHSESRGPVLLTVYRPIDLCADADARRAARGK